MTRRRATPRQRLTRTSTCQSRCVLVSTELWQSSCKCTCPRKDEHWSSKACEICIHATQHDNASRAQQWFNRWGTVRVEPPQQAQQTSKGTSAN